MPEVKLEIATMVAARDAATEIAAADLLMLVKADATIEKLTGALLKSETVTTTSVAAAGAVMDSDFSAADQIMVGSGAGTHSQVTLAASQLLGKKAAGSVVNLSAAETRTILNVEDGADVTDAVNIGSSIHGAATKATPVVADKFPLIDTEAANVIKTTTWANIKAVLKAYFDTLYNLYVHPNHSGEVTSVADGAMTITNAAVTLAKMANMATASLLGRNTAEVGTPEVLSKATALSLLNVEDGADVTANNDPKAHAASHIVGAADTIFPADPGSDKYLMWDDDPGQLVWSAPAGGGDALKADGLDQFAPTTSLELKGVISDETGSGALVFAESPTLVTPLLGTPTSGNLSNCSTAATNAKGVLKQAQASTINTGTATDEAVTPDALAGSNSGKRCVEIIVYDSTTDLATGDGKAYFVVPTELNGMNLVRVAATEITAGTTATTTIQIANVTDACDMLSTLMAIQTTETSTRTSTQPGVIDTDHDDVATGDVLRIDIDAVSTTKPKGLIVEMVFQLP